jgi:uncharacterized protein
MSAATSTLIDVETIREVSRFIVARFHPERVVLFGSYARGQADPNSDVDLLVEMPAPIAAPVRGNPVRRAIAERFVLPVDVVVQSSETVEKYRNDPFSLAHRALAEGVVLYDRRGA